MQRKIDLDRLVPGWEELHHGNKNPFNWNKLLNKFTDDKVQQLCGSDVALYLAFLRWASKFFFSISFVNMFVLYFYLTGENDSSKIVDKNSYAMSALTIMNIVGVEWKVFAVYCVAVGLVVFWYMILLALYNKKFSEEESIAADIE